MVTTSVHVELAPNLTFRLRISPTSSQTLQTGGSRFPALQPFAYSSSTEKSVYLPFTSINHKIHTLDNTWETSRALVTSSVELAPNFSFSSLENFPYVKPDASDRRFASISALQQLAYSVASNISISSASFPAPHAGRF